MPFLHRWQTGYTVCGITVQIFLLGAKFIPPPDTIAAMEAFDEYSSLMQNYVDPFVFIPKCISYQLLNGDVSASGGPATFQPNELKMGMVLPEIRNNIFLNGVEKFFKLIELFRSEPIYNELANHLEGMKYLCVECEKVNV